MHSLYLSNKSKSVSCCSVFQASNVFSSLFQLFFLCFVRALRENKLLDQRSFDKCPFCSDTTKPSSYFPRIISNLPCQCPPGSGIQISTSPSFSWTCKQCRPGNFSVGGMVIDTWERWNGSLNVPGSGYKFTHYCVTVIKGGSCQGWRPSSKSILFKYHTLIDFFSQYFMKFSIVFEILWFMFC